MSQMALWKVVVMAPKFWKQEKLIKLIVHSSPKERIIKFS